MAIPGKFQVDFTQTKPEPYIVNEDGSYSVTYTKVEYNAFARELGVKGTSDESATASYDELKKAVEDVLGLNKSALDD